MGDIKREIVKTMEVVRDNMVITRALLERIKQLEQEVEDLRATLEVKGDKELYDTIKSTDENTELYDEKDLKW